MKISVRRFQEITVLAYREVLMQPSNVLPISWNDFHDPDGAEVIITSYQEYSKLTKTPMRFLTLDGKYPDGLTIKNVRLGVLLILFNNDMPLPRKRHTIIHEIGHIVLGHKNHTDVEEIEAHFFATQFLMPNIIIKILRSRGYIIDEKFIMKCFSVSKEAAQKRIFYLDNYRDKHDNEHDSKMADKFEIYIDKYFPQIFEEYNKKDYLKGVCTTEDNHRAFFVAENTYLDPDAE